MSIICVELYIEIYLSNDVFLFLQVRLGFFIRYLYNKCPDVRDKMDVVSITSKHFNDIFNNSRVKFECTSYVITRDRHSIGYISWSAFIDKFG